MEEREEQMHFDEASRTAPLFSVNWSLPRDFKLPLDGFCVLSQPKYTYPLLYAHICAFVRTQCFDGKAMGSDEGTGVINCIVWQGHTAWGAVLGYGPARGRAGGQGCNKPN
eukprot:1162149-Pelagomonas_calceolata.AAC.4